MMGKRRNKTPWFWVARHFRGKKLSALFFFILKLKIHKIILLYNIFNTLKDDINFALFTESIQMKVKFLKEVLAFKIVVCKAKMPFTQTHLDFSLFHEKN